MVVAVNCLPAVCELPGPEKGAPLKEVPMAGWYKENRDPEARRAAAGFFLRSGLSLSWLALPG